MIIAHDYDENGAEAEDGLEGGGADKDDDVLFTIRSISVVINISIIIIIMTIINIIIAAAPVAKIIVYKFYASSSALSLS